MSQSRSISDSEADLFGKSVIHLTEAVLGKVGAEVVEERVVGRRRKRVVVRIVGMEAMGVRERERYVLGFGGDFLLWAFQWHLYECLCFFNIGIIFCFNSSKKKKMSANLFT
jgi:hypothetical protein